MQSTTFSPTEASFDRDVLERDGNVLVDFWAPWCGPCRSFKPVVEAVAAQRGGALGVAFVNVDEAPELGQRFDVRSIPALKLFRDGQLVAERTGGLSKTELEHWLDSHGA